MVPYLQIDGLTKSFGDLVLFNQISLGVAEGQRIGLIAKNGSGKTTLLNIIAGKEGYDEGSIVFRRDLCVGYLEQDPHYPEELTVRVSITVILSCNLLRNMKGVWKPKVIREWRTCWHAWNMKKPGIMNERQNRFFRNLKSVISISR